MLKDLFDGRRIFDTGNHLDRTAALLTGLDIDLELTFEALRRGHGGVALGGEFDLVGGLFAAPGRCYLGTVLAIGSKHAVEAGEVDPWFGNQGGQHQYSER